MTSVTGSDQSTTKRLRLGRQSEGLGAFRAAPALGWSVSVTFLLVGFVVPFVAIINKGLTDFAGREGLSLEAVWDTLSDDRLPRLVGFTLGQTLLSVVASILLGVPIAWTLARLDFFGRRLLGTLSVVPFVLPTIVVAGAYLATVSQSFAERRAVWLIVAAHLCLNIGVVVRTVGARIESIPPDCEAVAQSLGRSWFRSIFDTTIRMALPQIAAAALIVGLFCMTSFGVIIGLGNPSTYTVEVEIWYQTTQLLNLPVASVLAVLQMVLVLAVVSAHQWARSRNTVDTGSVVTNTSRQKPSSIGERLAIGYSVFSVLAVVGLPLGALLSDSLRSGGRFTLDNYIGLGDIPASANGSVSVLVAMANSMSFALVSTVLSMLVAIPVALMVASQLKGSSVLDRLIMLPMGASAATIGFGFVVAYSQPWLDLRGAWMAVPLVQAGVTVPLVVRAVVPSARSLDRSYMETAATCGAGPLRRFVAIWLPLMRPVFGAAAGFAFAISLGEFGATSFVARSARPTLPIVIADLLGRPGTSSFGAAMALSCVLVGVCGLVFVAVDRSGRGSVGSFG